MDRFNYDAVYPIYTLSQEEHARLIQHAENFYQTNPKRDTETEKNCVVQFVTSAHDEGIPNKPYLANLKREVPVHIGIRLITAAGDVYSFGTEVPLSERTKVGSEFDVSQFFSHFFTTSDARISMLDYEEFREHEERMVTSIPLTFQRAKNMLNRLNELNAHQLRFQFGRQNCSSLMLEMMQEAGYDIDMRSTLGAEIRAALPDANQLPLIGPLIGKVETFIGCIWNAVVNATPQCIRTGFSWLDYVIFYIPRKLGTIMTNLIIWKLGGSQYTSPLAQGTPDERLYNAKRIQSFSKVIRSWKDIFRDETSAINHSRFFLDWQKKQRSTNTFKSGARPKLCIL